VSFPDQQEEIIHTYLQGHQRHIFSGLVDFRLSIPETNRQSEKEGRFF
jgi:hypothetical protein